MPDVETQLEIAKITAERDVYKRLYEETMARRKHGSNKERQRKLLDIKLA